LYQQLGLTPRYIADSGVLLKTSGDITMWTDTTRALHARKELSLPSNLTDGEWQILEPYFPRPSHVGRPRKWPMRIIVEAMLYMLRGGLPKKNIGADDATGLSAFIDGAALVLSLAR
jgi:hypothetical protein